MPSEREKMESWSDDQLYDTLANSKGDSLSHSSAAAELMRRTNKLAVKVAQAQIAAATATIKTAEYTRSNARYMLYSVNAAVAAAFLSAVVAGIAWWFPRH
jgi:hypothetical protein